MFLGGAMAASLYDSAFATLGRIFGMEARRPITLLTFAGGFASTVGWPSTQFLIEHVGWRGAYLTFACLLAFIAAPLHAFALPRTRAEYPVLAPSEKSPSTQAASPPPAFPLLVIVVIAFAAYAFITSGLSAHMLTIIARGGLDTATAVAVGALFGPAQVLARFCEFSFGGKTHPLLITRFAVVLVLLGFALLLLMQISTATAVIFVLLFGISNGLITVARGTVPLVLFGPVGYGRMVGRIAGGSLAMQSFAPVALASAIEWKANPGGIVMLTLFAAVSLVAFSLANRRAAKHEPGR
jgi:MFS family permease